MNRLESPYFIQGLDQKEKQVPIAGMGLVIINSQTGRIWMVRENIDKPQSARYAGQWSIPLETMKVGEEPQSAIEGAMAEVFDDFDENGNDIRDQIVKSLTHIRGNSLHQGLQASHGGRDFDLNYAVIMYDGPEIAMDPYNSEEVSRGEWRDPITLLDANVRPFARYIGREVLREAYTDNLVAFHERPEDRLPVLPVGFSVRETYHKREQHPDIV